MIDEICLIGKAVPIHNDTDHDLSAVFSASDQDMAHQAFPGLFVVGRHLVQFHIGQHTIDDVFIDLLPEHAVCHGNDGMCPAGIEACHNPARRIPAGLFPCSAVSHRHLRFVSVPPGSVRIVLHAHDRFHDPVDLFFRKAPDPDQVRADFILLVLQFFLVRQRLQLTSSALPRDRTKRLHPVG